MRRNSGIIGLKRSTSLTTASGKFDTYDQYNSRLGNVWPKVKKLVSISPNSGNHFEGQIQTYGVTVSGYEDGDTVYYTILSLSGNVNSSDFKSGFTGSFEVNSSGYGEIFRLEVLRDATSETETFKIQIRDGSTSGTIIGESGTFTIPNPSYTLTASNSSPNEGDTVTFTLTGTDAYAGTHYYYMTSTAGNQNDINSLSGSYYYNGSTGVFSITITEDYLTEGSETLIAQARVTGTLGPVVASTTVTVNDTSQTVSATCTPDVSTVNEGSNVTFTVNTTNFTSGTLNWDTVLSADMENSDISATSGTVSISGSTGSIVITATSDGFTETGQTESFQVRVYDPLDALMVTSSAVTINDTSTGTAEPQGTDITTSFYEISNRFIASNTYMGNSSDYTGSYDVGEVQTNFSGSGRVYIGHKITSSTPYYSDVPIAGVQIISGTTLVASWIFNTSTGGSGSGWQTYTTQISGTSTQGFPVTPATASGYTYYNISTSATAGRFCWATGTGSSNTGAADGIGNTYKLSADGGSNTLAPVGDAQISQTASTYYAFHETSSPGAVYGSAVMRSPTYTFSGGEKIRVIHAVTGYSANQMDPDDTLYVAVY